MLPQPVDLVQGQPHLLGRPHHHHLRAAAPGAAVGATTPTPVGWAGGGWPENMEVRRKYKLICLRVSLIHLASHYINALF